MDNIVNYTALPLIENYKGLFRDYEKEGNKLIYDDIEYEFNYSDGTSDSYVKRGFDEERVQRLTRDLGLEQSYRIFTTNTTLRFKPKAKVRIGDREMTIVKVLPLLNTNDNIRMYNFAPDMYREMAVKLIYLE